MPTDTQSALSKGLDAKDAMYKSAIESSHANALGQTSLPTYGLSKAKAGMISGASTVARGVANFFTTAPDRAQNLEDIQNVGCKGRLAADVSWATSFTANAFLKIDEQLHRVASSLNHGNDQLKALDTKTYATGFAAAGKFGYALGTAA